MENKSKGKKKMLKIIIIVAACVAVLAIGFFVTIKILRNNVLDGPGMVNPAAVSSLYYYYGQDEYGRSTSISYKDSSFDYREDGGTVSGSVTGSYGTDDDFCNELESIIVKYQVYSWTDLEKSDLMVLDAPQTTLKIEFYSGVTVELGDDFEMPEDGWKAVKEIVSLFEQYMEK